MTWCCQACTERAGVKFYAGAMSAPAGFCSAGAHFVNERIEWHVEREIPDPADPPPVAHRLVVEALATSIETPIAVFAEQASLF